MNMMKWLFPAVLYSMPMTGGLQKSIAVLFQQILTTCKFFYREPRPTPKENDAFRATIVKPYEINIWQQWSTHFASKNRIDKKIWQT